MHINPLLGLVKAIPFSGRIWNSQFARSLRFKTLLRFGRRESETYTRFYRLPTQFKVLTGPVVDFILNGYSSRDLKIVVVGCSYGAEAYSISASMKRYRPELSYHIHGLDIDPYVLTRAEAARYIYRELRISPHFLNEAVENLFDLSEYEGEKVYDVKPFVRHPVTFSLGDALDPALSSICGQADIVFAQNFLYHLRPATSQAAFLNICRLLAPRGALFVDGMDLDLRQKLTRQAGLVPLTDEIEAIHADALEERGTSWPSIYWGLEPLSKTHKDWTYRYSTVFLQDLSNSPRTASSD